MIILPANYGLDATNPEAYVAIAVSSFIREVGKEKIHAEGTPTREYLGMLALYAIRWANIKPSDDERFKGVAKLAYEYFKPEEMSDNLERCLIDILGS
ncbi:hypothetical protein [Butyrivibrio sp. XPD2002]|uniref:hypothetical protein n=1 Tax=Butyrivibrio sp. XPD2002 TaxID=1280665 RepID=UPI00042364ED|nr:hypothetical protein [Butyrivibrio sp. XPD2002]